MPEVFRTVFPKVDGLGWVGSDHSFSPLLFPPFKE